MGFLQDLRFGVRMLWKKPGFTCVAVLTLAFGISVNSTVFTIVNAALINGLPFSNPREIVTVGWDGGGPASFLEYLDFRQQSRSFKGLGAAALMSADLSDEQAAAERVNGAAVTANLFPLLGQKPVIGRDFSADDEQLSASPVVLISHSLWRSRYGSKPDVLGSVLRVNLKPYTIIGVMPEGEAFPQSTRVWMPLVQDETRQKRDQRNVTVIGRLATGVSIGQARAEMKTIAGRLAQTYPQTNNKETSLTVDPYTDRGTRGPIRTILLTMQGAVAFVLLIACANVANLLLARAIDRVRETSIRTALGASRWRVVRQLLIESVMLSLLGGAVGLAFAVVGVRWFDAAVADTGKPYWIVFTMDYRVFAHFLAICVVTGILFGLAPALQVSKTDINETLREGGRGSSAGVRARRMTGALLIGEIGLTLVLLAGAGLMGRSFLYMQQFDLGVETDNLISAQVQPAGARYPQPANRLAFQENLMKAVSALPGLEAATIASQPPAGGAVSKTLNIENRNIADANQRLPVIARISVTPGYFQALRLKLSHGRDFNEVDGSAGAEAVIVNEPFAAKFFPGESPLGKRIRLGQDINRGTDDPNAPWATIIGVSPAVLQQSNSRDLRVEPTVYIPFRQEPTIAFTVLARSRLPQDQVIASIRTALRNVDPDLPLYNIRSMDELIRQRLWPFRVFGTLFATFALIALAISSVGIYAVTAYGVGQRTQEIGVRMALGASSRHVMWLVLRQGFRRIILGLTLGLLGAWGLSRVLAGILVGVTPTDPLTFILISLLLATVTTVACLIPARRAMRLDPVEALRTE